MLVGAGCSSPPPAPVTERSIGARQAGDVHVVRRGETLYSIAWVNGLDYRTVAAWNRIPAPYRIFPGQRLRMKAPPAIQARRRPASPAPRPEPKTNERNEARAPVRSQASRPPAKPAVAASPSPKVTKPNPARRPPARSLHWMWPVDGPLLKSYAANSSAKKGIAIGGRPGQPIRATEDGEVVYSGNGLHRYGNLIILKHNRSFFSAYAHNRTLLVREGAQVKRGQRIAELGRSGTDRPMLHFELRRDGKAVDPLRYLPRRRL